MDFVRLGERYTHSYIPDTLVEGYNSLIWTERYDEWGEFELKSFDVEGMTDLLPEDTLVSHLETREVMMVETQSIEMVGEGEDAVPEITIKGRSAGLILEHRWVESSYQKKRRMRKKYSATSAMCVLLWQAVDNNTGNDVTRGDATPDEDHTLADGDFSWNTLDDIPNVQVTEKVAVEGEARWWQLEEGALWPQFQKIMKAQDLGFRLLRPVSPNPGKVITIKSNLADRGDVVRTDTADISGLRFEIYAGIDRTSGANAVQLSQLQGHIDKPTYLVSKQNYESVVETIADVAVSDVYRAGTAGDTGWERRTVGQNGGSAEIPDAPDKPADLKSNATDAAKKQYKKDMDKWIDQMARWRNKKANILADFREEQEKMANRVLKQHRRVNMFAGDVSDVAPYKYKQHYDLGDTIMMYGDYGKSAKMVVQEYVRTENADGDRGFPGLVEP